MYLKCSRACLWLPYWTRQIRNISTITHHTKFYKTALLHASLPHKHKINIKMKLNFSLASKGKCKMFTSCHLPCGKYQVSLSAQIFTVLKAEKNLLPRRLIKQNNHLECFYQGSKSFTTFWKNE